MINFFKSIIYSRFQIITRIYGAIFNKKGYHTFSGWGLTTTSTFPPWTNVIKNKTNIHNLFIKIHNNLRKKIKEGSFTSTENRNFKSLKEHFDRLDYLKWRQYIIFYSALHAATHTKSKIKNFVECGVGDGFSIFYAINALKESKISYKSYLFDSWGPMKKKFLNKNEKKSFTENKYEFLNFNTTKKNFSEEKNIKFIKGYLPDTLRSINIKKISWLSIDLNSSKPTIKILDYLYNKVEKGGIIILDDYGGGGYIETKLAVDKFFLKKKSLIFQIPTGQALIIKK